ncbi:MAG: hypothetical protein GWP08_06530 [Nitrospiraceae bacterium]|nr:hypothetical protein [Nitrospiraceae bacterium]
MIQISLTAALVMYSAILGLMVLTIWAYTEIVTRRSYHVLEKQHLWRCVYCGYVYLDEEAEALSQCPQCESINSSKDKRARYVKTRRSAASKETAPAATEHRRNPSHRKRPHQRRRGPRRR